MLDIIRLVRYYNEAVTERYRSGHNEAVLKTVCPQGRVGSSPTLCALNVPDASKEWMHPEFFILIPFNLL